MTKAHLKRIALPRTWNIPRKSLNRKSMKFVSRPNPGKLLSLSVSINTFLKEIVNISKTKKEVKALLKFKNVFVNGTKVKDDKFPVGLFDVVYLKESEQAFRLTLTDNGKLSSIEINLKEKDSLLRKIQNKTLLKSGKIQFNFFGSANVILEKNEGKVGDVLLLENNKVKKKLSLEKGNTVMLIAGRHIGAIAKVIDIQDAKIFIELDGNEIETLRKYAYVIGEKTPIIKVRE